MPKKLRLYAVFRHLFLSFSDIIILMKTNDNTPFFTEEQLNQMDVESLRKLCDIMSGQIKKTGE